MTFIDCHSSNCLKIDLKIMLVQWKPFPGKQKHEIHEEKSSTELFFFGFN